LTPAQLPNGDGFHVNPMSRYELPSRLYGAITKKEEFWKPLWLYWSFVGRWAIWSGVMWNAQKMLGHVNVITWNVRWKVVARFQQMAGARQ